MENVSGMVKGKMKLVFAEAMRELKASGYKVSTRLMNAMYFNVPQSRQRLIFVGTREDMGKEPSHPMAESRPITVKEAIGHLPIGQQGSHEPQVLRAWRLSAPGKSLGETCRYVGSFQSCRLDPNAPSPTQIKSHLNWHYAVARQLTSLEAGILSSFPMAFTWAGSKANYKERIGNSVPPLFMRAIARHIRREILGRQG
jgi:DNA (cytosine-5)-methyltransferase 1